MKAKHKNFLLLGTVLVVLILVAYLLGMYQGRSHVAEVTGQMMQFQTQLLETREQVVHARNQERMMQALVLIYQTALDLDDRNFGTANRRLQEAADLLAQVETHNPETLAQLQQDLDAMDIEVAVNLASQRVSVLALAQRLQALLSEAASLLEAPTDTTALASGASPSN